MADEVVERFRGATYVWKGVGGTTDRRAKMSFIADARTRIRVRASTARGILAYVGVPGPEYTIVSARLEIAATDVWPGSRQMTVQRLARREPLRQITWNDQPGVHAASSPVSLTQAGTKLVWSFDVLADVLRARADNEPINGWRISTTEDGLRFFHGPEARRTWQRPRLVFGVVETPPAPTNLIPSRGLVSVAKPSLGFTQPVAFDRLQVQVDVDGGTFASPLWSSGTVTATTPVLDLAATNFPGLANLDDRDWRVRVGNEAGWSPWSLAGRLARVVKGTLAITSPGAVTSDGSPPITHVLTGATQTAVRRRILSADGDVLWRGRWSPSAATTAYPDRGLTEDGQTGTVIVDVRDNVDREATPGDPDFVTATRDFTLDLGFADPTASLVASNVGPAPWVRLSFMWSQTPDEWRILASDPPTHGDPVFADLDAPLSVLAVLDGAEPADGAQNTWWDYTARANHPRRYQVQAVVNDIVVATSQVSTVVPTIRGLWVHSIETGEDAMILGSDEVAAEYPQNVERLLPVGGLNPVLVYGSAYDVAGTLTGLVANAYGRFGADELATLHRFRQAPAGPYRVAWTDQNVEASLENVQPSTRRAGTAPGRVFGTASVGFQAIRRDWE